MTRRGSLLLTLGFLLVAAAALGAAWLARPVTLRVAIGPADLEHAQLMTAFARRLQTERAPLRLSLLRLPDNAAIVAALDSGRADAAVVRSDRMPRQGLTTAVFQALPLLLAVPRGPAGPSARRTRNAATAPIRGVGDLAGRRVGVLRGSPENLALLGAVLQQAGIDPARVTRLELDPQHVAEQVAQLRPDAIAVVGNWPSALRELALHPPPPQAPWSLHGVAEAAALARRDPAYDAIDIPRGFLSGAPMTPADDLTTLAVTQHLVARRDLDPDTVAQLTRLLFENRALLAGDVPLAKTIHAPDTEAESGEATLPVHPGALAYHNGEMRSFFDRWGDLFYLGAMVVTAIASGVGALWSTLRGRRRRDAARFAHKLFDLLARARRADGEEPLVQIERASDALLGLAFKRMGAGHIDASQFASVCLINQQVQQAVEQRRRALR